MVTIKNFSMPHNCYDCDLHNYHECDLTTKSIEEDYCWNGDSREKHCPLREVEAIPKDQINKVIDKIDRSMECVMESDPRTLKNPQHEYGWLFDKIYEWRKELKGLENGNDER